MANTKIIDWKVKQAFIRDDYILKRVDKNKARALRRFGAILRRNARKKLRRKPTKKRKKAAPGEPPLTHFGEPNLRTILYAMEGSDTIVIGPVGFKSRGGTTVPETLEYGLGEHEEHPWMNPTLEENFRELGNSMEKFGLI